MEPSCAKSEEVLGPETKAFYSDVIKTLQAHKVPFLAGGAYAFDCYTGITRHTKDFDLFVRPGDSDRVLQVLRESGYGTESTYPHWLAKAYHNDDFIDVIFRSGNGLSMVDESWFEDARDSEVFDIPVKLCPPEQIIFQKSFIMERERFDGADVIHLIHACGRDLRWKRLLQIFDGHWRVLLSHLVLFGYIYPGERTKVPEWVLKELLGLLLGESTFDEAIPEPVCRGTLLSRQQYLPDIEQWGYRDARLYPSGNMTPSEIARWTEAIDDDIRGRRGEE